MSGFVTNTTPQGRASVGPMTPASSMGLVSPAARLSGTSPNMQRPSAQIYSLGSVQAMGLSALQAQQDAQDQADAQARQSDSVITGLAGHVRACWSEAWMAKLNTVEQRMIENLRARRGEYDPERLAAIRQAGGSEIYMMITSLKCRAAGSWIRDVILGQGGDKPWAIMPSMVPEISPDQAQMIVDAMTATISQANASGQPMTPEDTVEQMRSLRDQEKAKMRDTAVDAAARMADKMETQLLEGGWMTAMNMFIEDLTTYPSAILKGPIIRNKPKLKWVQAAPDAGGSPTPAGPGQAGAPGAGLSSTAPGVAASNTVSQPSPSGAAPTPDAPNAGGQPAGAAPGGQPTSPAATPTQGATSPGKWTPQVQNTLVMEWERVDPFNIYPSPSAATCEDGYLIEKLRLSRRQLLEMKGVDGYDDGAIDLVLERFGDAGFREWTTNDTQYAESKGQSTTAIMNNSEGLIDALQYWGSVQGSTLIDWGMGEDEVPDPQDEYDCEVWLIGDLVIKAVLNYDPMHRRPYYKSSYEEVPGAFWGNCVADLIRDVQLVCNAASRALVNNMGIASGPQVTVNIDRIPAGEDLTQMVPWKIWQVTNDPMNNNNNTGGKPIAFDQPDSRIQELSGILTMYSALADEYSGVPRYMSGEAPGGGTGRTASGMSMLMGNAGKAIKQVIAALDINVTTPMLERLYYYNMRFAEDADLKGDVSIVARGTNALINKDAVQVRRNEFLQSTMNSTDMQIVGIEGRAAILRESAKDLDLDADRIVPPPDVLREKLAIASKQSAAQAKQDKADAFQHELALAAVKHSVPGVAPSSVLQIADSPLPLLVDIPKAPAPPAPPPGMMPGAPGQMPGPMPGPMPQPGGPPGPMPPSPMPMPTGRTPPMGAERNKQVLEGGKPITDNFSPMRKK
jgi:hypothetical protein